MRRLFILLLLSLGCLLTRAPIFAQNDPAGEVIQRVNALRLAYGVPAYQVDAILMQVAQAQASWSAANNHIGHDGPGGSMPNDRAQAAGYGGGARSYATENAAHGSFGYNTPELVVTMWQGDWGHLNAMVSPEYEHIGVGYAEANGFSWYVMMAGWVADGAAPGSAQPQEALPSAAPNAPFVPGEPDETGAIYHSVQAGQSLWSIAANYGLELAELMALNDLTETSIIQPGDVLLIRPADRPTSTPSAQAKPDAAAEQPETPSAQPAAEIALKATDLPAATAGEPRVSEQARLPEAAEKAPVPQRLAYPMLSVIMAGLVSAFMLFIVVSGRRRK